MRWRLLTPGGRPRLLLMMAGWAMDPQPLAQALTATAGAAYDAAVTWDYTEPPTALPEGLHAERYQEVVLVAWSFGVFAASRALDAATARRVTLAVALCGTPAPVDPLAGIPPRVFALTLRGMTTPEALLTFYRRAVGADASPDAWDSFQVRLPRRTVDDCAAELQALPSHQQTLPCRFDAWDVAVVADDDAIFPPDAQRRHWRRHPGCRVMEIPGAHLPADLGALLSGLVKDKDRVARRFAARRDTYPAAAQPQEAFARRLWQLAKPLMPVREGLRVVEAGSGTGMLTRLYLPCLPPGADVRLWDLVDYGNPLPPATASFTACDAEAAMAAQPHASLDAVLSASTIQWFNSPARFIANAARALRPGGMAAVSAFAPGHFADLYAILGHGLELPQPRELARIAADAGCQVVDAVTEDVPVAFASVRLMLDHLRRTGVTSLSHPAPTAAVRRLLERYPTAQDGSAVLHYRPTYLTFLRL